MKEYCTLRIGISDLQDISLKVEEIDICIKNAGSSYFDKMHDGKSVTAIEKFVSCKTISQACHMCDLKPSQFSEKGALPDCPEIILDMSLLHIWMRALEYILQAATQRNCGEKVPLESELYKAEKAWLCQQFKV